MYIHVYNINLQLEELHFVQIADQLNLICTALISI